MDAYEQLDVVFYGVRGSRPVVSARHLEYGGNTACVGVRAGSKWILLDAGSGIAGASHPFSADETVDVFLSHLHHDHVMGLMFFRRIQSRERVSIYLHESFLASLEPYWASPYFPIHLRDASPRVSLCPLGAKTSMRWIGSGWTAGDPCEQEGLWLHAMFLPEVAHPRDGVMVYKVVYHGKSVVYASDVELGDARVMEAVADFSHGATVLICDAHYTDEEYRTYRGWGHSSLEMAIRLAERCEADQLVLFHHHPDRDDDAMRALEADARRRFGRAVAAREGLRITC